MAYVGKTPAATALTANDLQDGIVSADKLASNAVTTVKVNADAITNAKTEFTPGLVIKGDGASADGKLTLNCSQNSHGVSIQGPPHSAGQSYTLTLPQSITDGYFLRTDSLGNLSFASATETKPTVTNTSQTIAPATATDITITGTNFVSIPQVEFVKTDGSVTVANSITFTSSTSLSVNVTLATGNYFVRVENPDGLAGVSSTAVLQASPGPIWQTASGSLGSVIEGQSGSFTVAAATSDSVTVTFSETTSVLSGTGLSLNSSTGVISGTANAVSADTTYTFTIRATDTESQTADRQFSFTISNANYFGDGSDGALDTTP